MATNAHPATPSGTSWVFTAQQGHSMVHQVGIHQLSQHQSNAIAQLWKSTWHVSVLSLQHELGVKSTWHLSDPNEQHQLCVWHLTWLIHFASGGCLFHQPSDAELACWRRCRELSEHLTSLVCECACTQILQNRAQRKEQFKKLSTTMTIHLLETLPLHLVLHGDRSSQAEKQKSGPILKNQSPLKNLVFPEKSSSPWKIQFPLKNSVPPEKFIPSLKIEFLWKIQFLLKNSVPPKNSAPPWKIKSPWKISPPANPVPPEKFSPPWKIQSPLKNSVPPEKSSPPWKIQSPLKNPVPPEKFSPPWKIQSLLKNSVFLKNPVPPEKSSSSPFSFCFSPHLSEFFSMGGNDPKHVPKDHESTMAACRHTKCLRDGILFHSHLNHKSFSPWCNWATVQFLWSKREHVIDGWLRRTGSSSGWFLQVWCQMFPLKNLHISGIDRFCDKCQEQHHDLPSSTRCLQQEWLHVDDSSNRNLATVLPQTQELQTANWNAQWGSRKTSNNDTWVEKTEWKSVIFVAFCLDWKCCVQHLFPFISIKELWEQVDTDVKSAGHSLWPSFHFHQKPIHSCHAVGHSDWCASCGILLVLHLMHLPDKRSNMTGNNSLSWFFGKIFGNIFHTFQDQV